MAKRLADEESCAVYTCCYGHTLNLAASDTLRQLKLLKDALDTTSEVSRLIKFSPKGNRKHQILLASGCYGQLDGQYRQHLL